MAGRKAAFMRCFECSLLLRADKDDPDVSFMDKRRIQLNLKKKNFLDLFRVNAPFIPPVKWQGGSPVVRSNAAVCSTCA